MKDKSEDIVYCTPVDENATPEFRALEGPEADDELAKLAKAIGHPARVRIIRMLSRKEARVCSQIVDELPLAQSTVSEHLRILKEAGLGTQQSRWSARWLLHQFQYSSQAEGSDRHHLIFFDA